MNRLVICQTPFQVITALQIRHQFFNDKSRNDIVIMNTFSSYENVAARLKSLGLFVHVYIFDAKKMCVAKSKEEKLYKATRMLFPKLIIDDYWNGNFEFYDELYTGNYDEFVIALRSYQQYCKHYLKTCLYEDGAVTYMNLNNILPKSNAFKMIEARNKITGIGNIVRENLDGIIIRDKKLFTYEPSCKVIELDADISRSDRFKEELKTIFSVDNTAAKYNRRYIVFEDWSLANDPGFPYMNFIEDLCEHLGSDNIIVKLHPRTEADRYSELGVKTLGADGIPWEAIVATGDFKDKVLITISSSSLIGTYLLFGTLIKSYMLYKPFHLKLPWFTGENKNFWERFDSGNNDGIRMPDTMEEFYKNLEN